MRQYLEKTNKKQLEAFVAWAMFDRAPFQLPAQVKGMMDGFTRGLYQVCGLQSADDWEVAPYNLMITLRWGDQSSDSGSYVCAIRPVRVNCMDKFGCFIVVLFSVVFSNVKIGKCLIAPGWCRHPSAQPVVVQEGASTQQSGPCHGPCLRLILWEWRWHVAVISAANISLTSYLVGRIAVPQRRPDQYLITSSSAHWSDGCSCLQLMARIAVVSLSQMPAYTGESSMR